MAAAVSEFRPQVIDRVDSNKIYVGGEVVYEMGSYLGGGNASTVYECKAADRPDTGDELPKEVEAGKLPLRREHVWWMYHASTKQVIPCWTDPSAGGQIRELALPKCVEVWGWNPPQAGSPECLSLSAAKAKFNTGADDTAAAGGGTTQSAIANVRMEVVAKRRKVVIPEVPPRFINLIFARRKVFREIAVMRRLPEHPNILQLHDVCEQVQDNRCCLHIVLELADGGELFDRIKLDQGCSEVVACDYFQQLLAGVQFCHSNGVAHRDLKPENLLLTENDRDPAYQEQEGTCDLTGQNPPSSPGLAPLQPPMHGDREQTASSGMASSIRTRSTSPAGGRPGHSHQASFGAAPRVSSTTALHHRQVRGTQPTLSSRDAPLSPGNAMRSVTTGIASMHSRGGQPARASSDGSRYVQPSPVGSMGSSQSSFRTTAGEGAEHQRRAQGGIGAESSEEDEEEDDEGWSDGEDEDEESQDAQLKEADGVTLKIADFGLSALMAAAEDAEMEDREVEAAGGSRAAGLRRVGGLSVGGASQSGGDPLSLRPVPRTPQQIAMKRLRSVVGSPHYCAPEVLGVDPAKIVAGQVKMGPNGEVVTTQGRVGTGVRAGYDGAKVDAWSCGVILYALLAGKLPFGSNLAQCPRFKQWSVFVRKVEDEQAALRQSSTVARAGSSSTDIARRLEPQLTEPMGNKAVPSPASSPPTATSSGSDMRTDGEEDDTFAETPAPLGPHVRVPQPQHADPGPWPPSELPSFPSWFILEKFSPDAKRLVAGLLHPAPARRWTVAEALSAEWTVSGLRAIMEARQRRRARRAARKAQRREQRARERRQAAGAPLEVGTGSGWHAQDTGPVASDSADAAAPFSQDDGRLVGSKAGHFDAQSKSASSGNSRMASSSARDMFPGVEDSQAPMEGDDDVAGADANASTDGEDEPGLASTANTSVLSDADRPKQFPSIRGCMSAPMAPMGPSSDLVDMPPLALGSSAMTGDSSVLSGSIPSAHTTKDASRGNSNPGSPQCQGQGGRVGVSSPRTAFVQSSSSSSSSSAVPSSSSGIKQDAQRSACSVANPVRRQGSTGVTRAISNDTASASMSDSVPRYPSATSSCLDDKQRDPRDSIGFSPALGAMATPGSSLHYGVGHRAVLPPRLPGQAPIPAGDPVRPRPGLGSGSRKNSAEQKKPLQSSDAAKSEHEPKDGRGSERQEAPPQPAMEDGNGSQHVENNLSMATPGAIGALRRHSTNPDAIERSVTTIHKPHATAGGPVPAGPNAGAAGTALPSLADRLPRLDPEHSVRRSSRVTTSVPATVVLARIAELVRTEEDLLLHDAMEAMRSQGEAGGGAPEGVAASEQATTTGGRVHGAGSAAGRFRGQLVISGASGGSGTVTASASASAGLEEDGGWGHGGAEDSIAAQEKEKEPELSRVGGAAPTGGALSGHASRLRMARAASAPSGEHPAGCNLALSQQEQSKEFVLPPASEDRAPAFVVASAATSGGSGVRRSVTEMGARRSRGRGKGKLEVYTDYRACKLEARLDGERVLEVRVLLHPNDSRLQVVEVLRAGLGIFAFKRFFDTLRQRLSRVIRE